MKSELRYVLDKRGKIGITLMTFDTLQEMDLYMRRFKDSNDVKEMFLDLINCFLRSSIATNYLQEEAKRAENYDGREKEKPRENNGFIKGFTPYNGVLRHVHLLYQNPLYLNKKCFTILRRELKERKILYDLKYRKFFIIPPIHDITSELTRAVDHHQTTTYIARDFVNYIEKLPEGEKYIVLRFLSDKCHIQQQNTVESDNIYKMRFDKVGNEYTNFHLIKTRKYSFGYLADEELYENPPIGATVEPRDDILDFKRRQIVELLQEYDLDDIDRMTTYFDGQGKGAKK